MPSLSSVHDHDQLADELNGVSVFRCAKRADLVEVHDHNRWPAPAMGLMGPPQEPHQGGLGPRAAQTVKQGFCWWCKETDHLIAQCPLQAYASEPFLPDSKPNNAPTGKRKADPEQGMPRRVEHGLARQDWCHQALNGCVHCKYFICLMTMIWALRS